MIKTEDDCIVWLKFDNQFFDINNDIYLAVTYIVPENSPIHLLYDIGLFSRLDVIMLYSTKGVVFLTGDFNVRTGVRHDYIENALGRNDAAADLYMNDIPMMRKSHDKTVNRFGDLLLDLCKASGLSFVNGRIYGNRNGSYTCMAANGESAVGYLLTAYSNFDILSNFQVLPFDEYTNH